MMLSSSPPPCDPALEFVAAGPARTARRTLSSRRSLGARGVMTKIAALPRLEGVPHRGPLDGSLDHSGGWQAVGLDHHTSGDAASRRVRVVRVIGVVRVVVPYLPPRREGPPRVGVPGNPGGASCERLATKSQPNLVAAPNFDRIQTKSQSNSVATPNFGRVQTRTGSYFVSRPNKDRLQTTPDSGTGTRWDVGGAWARGRKWYSQPPHPLIGQ